MRDIARRGGYQMLDRTPATAQLVVTPPDCKAASRFTFAACDGAAVTCAAKGSDTKEWRIDSSRSQIYPIPQVVTQAELCHLRRRDHRHRRGRRPLGSGIGSGDDHRQRSEAEIR
jgi:hypothetical protein